MPRFEPRLFSRLYAGYVVIIVLTTLIVGVLVSRQVTQNSTREIHQSLAVRSELLSEIAREALLKRAGSLQQTVIELGRKTGSRLTIISTDGVVIADSRESPSNMDNHRQRPEIVEADRMGSAITSRYSETLQQQMIYRAVTVVDQGRNIGFVRVSLPLTFIDEKLLQLRLIVLFGASIAAIAALLLGFYFARRFSNPLADMTEIAEAISRGEFERRIAINRQDEIGKLAGSINRMARSSAARMSEITADRNLLAKIFSSMVEGVIGIDQDQQVIHINQAAADLLDLSVEDSISKPIWEGLRIEEITSALQHAMETKDLVKAQMRRSFDKGERVIDISAVALRDDEGQTSGAVIVLHDVTELDRLARIRRDFVANASHELKTPITAIRGLVETILDDAEMPSETRDSFVNKIRMQSLRLSTLVSDLITISRLESDQRVQDYQNQNLAKIVGRSISEIEQACHEKNISIRFNESDEDFPVKGDLQALGQLIDNLLDNAVNYTPEEGVITVNLSKTRSTVQLEVIDTGIGISPQYQQRVFERFYRVDKARSRELGGTGLGLSIVKNIAEHHNGTVSLKSRPGAGSTFTVNLPLAQ